MTCIDAYASQTPRTIAFAIARLSYLDCFGGTVCLETGHKLEPISLAASRTSTDWSDGRLVAGSSKGQYGWLVSGKLVTWDCNGMGSIDQLHSALSDQLFMRCVSHGMKGGGVGSTVVTLTAHSQRQSQRRCPRSSEVLIYSAHPLIVPGSSP